MLRDAASRILSCGVHGRIRTAYDTRQISLELVAPMPNGASGGVRVALPYQLPVSFRAKTEGSSTQSPVRAELTASRNGATLAAPSGESWQSPEVYGTAAVVSKVPLAYGSTTSITLSGRSGGDSRSLVLEARLDPVGLPDGGAVEEAILRVEKKFEASDSSLPPVSYFKGWAVEATGEVRATGTSGDYGQFSIPVCSTGDAFACTAINTGTRFSVTKEDLPEGGQKVVYTPISTSYKLCSTAYSMVSASSFHRSDLIADLRVLAGSLVFKNRDGSLVGGRCDASAITERKEDGGLETIAPGDVAQTEVHFFREDQKFKEPIARYVVAVPGTEDGSRCDSSAHARYVRVRTGPQAPGERRFREQCEWMRMSPDPATQQAWQRDCKDLERTNLTRLSPGDRLVVFAVNHATGYAGMKTVVVPEITTSAVPAGQSCPADDQAGGPIVFEDPWANPGSGAFRISRCAQENVFIGAAVELYPPEIEVRVARRRTDQGARNPTTRQEHLVRHGGAATTEDDVIQLSTHWRVRLGIPPTPPSNATNGPLEVYCSELPENPGEEAVRACQEAEKYLADVPAGVPPIAAHVVRVSGSAVEQPAVSVFKVPPGRATGNVQTSQKLISAQTGGGVTTLPGLSVGNYYVHVVGHSLLFNDLNGNGRVDPEELDQRDPPPPNLTNMTPDGPPGLPLRAVELKNVYDRQPDYKAPMKRVAWYDRAREHEFRVSLIQTEQVLAVTPSGTRRLDLVGTRPAATDADISYELLASMIWPSDGRAGTMSPQYLIVRLGTEAGGIDCTVRATASGIRADCGDQNLLDIITARDIFYLEILLNGNAENVLYRFNVLSLLASIQQPPNNPDPQESDWQTNTSFIVKRPLDVNNWPTGNATGETVTATGLVPAQVLGSELTWSVDPGPPESLYTSTHGETFTFIPNPPEHPEYSSGTGCGNSGNGTCAVNVSGKNVSLQYTIGLEVRGDTDRHTIKQDQRDTIRQEYANHGLYNWPAKPWAHIPERVDFVIPHASAHFPEKDVNQTNYKLILGDPTLIAEEVYSKYNELMNDKQSVEPNTAGLDETSVIIESHSISYFGVLPLRTEACNGAPRPNCPDPQISLGDCCDDYVVGNTIVAGVDGIAETWVLPPEGYGLHLNSGWRNPERNEAFSEAVASLHQWGSAVDLKPTVWRFELDQRGANCVLYDAAILVPHHDVRPEGGQGNDWVSCNTFGVRCIHVDR